MAGWSRVSVEFAGARHPDTDALRRCGGAEAKTLRPYPNLVLHQAFLSEFSSFLRMADTTREASLTAV